MKKLASTQKVLAFFYLNKKITIKYEIMETNVNPTPQNVEPNVEPAQVVKTVADHGCKDFHYTTDDLDQIEKKRAEAIAKVDLGLQKHLGHY